MKNLYQTIAACMLLVGCHRGIIPENTKFKGAVLEYGYQGFTLKYYSSALYIPGNSLTPEALAPSPEIVNRHYYFTLNTDSGQKTFTVTFEEGMSLERLASLIKHDSEVEVNIGKRDPNKESYSVWTCDVEVF